MAKQVAPAVASIPPATGIADPAVRRSIQALIDAHNTRNGPTNERFLTASDLDQLAGKVVYKGLTGGAAGQGGGVLPTGTLDPAVTQALETAIFGTLLWEKLSTKIEYLTAQNSLSVARIGELADGFSSERIERRDQNSAVLEQVDAMRVSIDNNAAAILEERQVRTTNDSALAQAINTIFGAVGANNALVQDGSSVAVNWTAAQASKWSQLQAEVFTQDGKTIRAALAEEKNLRVDMQGKIDATWSVRLNADGTWAGFGLGLQGVPGAIQSTFIVTADKFAIVTPGAAPTTPFTVQGGKAYIKSAMIGEASIGTAQIKDLAVDTLKIAGNAVTIPLNVTWSNSMGGVGLSNWIDVANLTVTAGPDPLPVIGLFSARVGYTAGVKGTAYRVLANGAVLVDYGNITGATMDFPNFAFSAIVPANSTQTFTVEFAGSDSTVSMGYRSFTLLGVKR